MEHSPLGHLKGFMRGQPFERGQLVSEDMQTPLGHRAGRNEGQVVSGQSLLDSRHVPSLHEVHPLVHRLVAVGEMYPVTGHSAAEATHMRSEPAQRTRALSLGHSAMGWQFQGASTHEPDGHKMGDVRGHEGGVGQSVGDMRQVSS